MHWPRPRVALFSVLLSISGSAIALEAPGQQTLQELLDTAGVPNWLLLLDATIDFEAGEIRTETVTLSNVKVPIEIARQTITINEAHAHGFEGDLSFDLLIDQDADSFDATIRAENIALAHASAPHPETDLQNPARIFSNAEILPQWLSAYRGRLTLELSSFRVNETVFQQFNGDFNLQQEILSGRIQGELIEGHIQVNFVHQHKDETTRITAVGTAIPLDLMSATRDYWIDTALSFELNLDGQGRSARNFAETLNGGVIVETMHGNIDVRKLEKLSQDILSLTLSSVVPFTIERKTSHLECGVLKFSIENGVANSDNAIALRTQNLAVMGGGKIDFAGETLDIRLHPHARSTKKINTKTAVKELKLSGPLTDIQVTPQLGGIINQGISLTTKIAALSLSKLRLPLFDWAAPADVACMSSLEASAP